MKEAAPSLRDDIFARFAEGRATEISSVVERGIESELEEYCRWKRKEEQARLEARDIAKSIRGGVRARVEDLFQSFIETATPEEMYLMADVLNTHHVDGAKHADEIFLAHAFSCAVAEHWSRYIEVPGWCYESVRAFVDALKAKGEEE